ncbi:MAG: hypothetical protein U0W24_21520 [Bacteroidales bacterium]
MDNKALTPKIEEILDAIENLIPKYLEDPKDQLISDGNVAVCIIDKEGNVYGRLFGKDKIRSRRALCCMDQSQPGMDNRNSNRLV